MSVMSSLRRSVYGVPPRHERDRKFRFFRKVREERADVSRRAAVIFDRELERKERRRLTSKSSIQVDTQEVVV